MSTDFEDRIARLNARNGVQPTATQPVTAQQGASRPRRVTRTGGSLATCILVGILILVVMPIGAAMGTIYFAQIGDRLAVVSKDVQKAPLTENMDDTEHRKPVTP